jgi:histone acetyltransferase HTATIP
VRKETIVVNGVGELGVNHFVLTRAELVKLPEPSQKGHYAVTTTLKSLAQACHLRVDDVQLVLHELGFLRYRRAIPPRPIVVDSYDEAGESTSQYLDDHDTTDWTDVELVITRDAVDEQWAKWRVRDAGVLDEMYALLDKY